MSVIARKARMPDVAAVVNNISEISAAEISTIGYSYLEVCETALEGVKRGHAVAGELDGRVGCLFWFYPDEGDCFTYFLAAKSYFDNPLAYTKATRRALAECTKLFPGVNLLSLSKSKHPDTVKWFKAIGFRHVRDVHDGKVFEYCAT